MNQKNNPTTAPIARCVIYTRTANGEFDSLQTQRRSGEAWIADRDGYCQLLDRYDDDGFSGSDPDRPAWKRLLTEVEAGRIDCVIVDDLSRISRSVSDANELNAFFSRHNVALVSVRQRCGRET